MKRLAAALAALIALAGPAWAQSCYPDLDPDRAQFVIGYGSLMERESKLRSAPTAGLNHPVRVEGFQRAWNTRGSSIGFSTTYLGVERAETAEMVAVVYAVGGAADIEGTDERESSYCRHRVPAETLTLLDGWSLPEKSEVWIYVNQPESAHPPSPRWPIVQSYVDIFLTGCLQLQRRLLPEIAAELEFPKSCIRSTRGWSPHWKNDRLMPRRAFIHQPNASDIDRLLAAELPDLFRRIEIE